MPEDYVDYRFGFQVKIATVEIVDTPVGSVPLVDNRLLAEEVCRQLANKPTRLTGNEVRFLRLHFEMTLQKFGQCLGVTHAAVKRWQKAGDEAAGMKWSCEMCLRLLTLLRLRTAPSEVTKLLSSLTHQRPEGQHVIYVAKDVAPEGVRRQTGKAEYKVPLAEEQRPRVGPKEEWNTLSHKPRDCWNEHKLANAA